MDNVTHTLVGIALGRSGANKKSKTDEALWTAVIGSNLPDLDFLMRPFGWDGNLGYLLQHRGFTHTVLLSIPLGVIAALLGAKLGKSKKLFQPKLCLLGMVAILLHIGMDYWNNYGVHPFSPFFNRWFYGDTLFILEPLIWFALLPFAFYTSKSKWGRVLAASLGLGLLGVAWTRYFNPWQIAIFLSAWSLVFVFLQQRNRLSLKAPLAGVLVVLFIFHMGSWRAAGDLKSIIETQVGHGQGSLVKIHDVVVSPAPSNPFCWGVIGLTTENKSETSLAGGRVDYVARLGVMSLWPQVFGPESCYLLRGNEFLKSVSFHSENLPGIYWYGEFRADLKEFELLRESNCKFSTFLKFARVPRWFSSDNSLFAADLRYDREGGRGFSRIDITPPTACPKDVPPWEPPTTGLVPKASLE